MPRLAAHHRPPPRHGQRGVYAIEYGLVFLFLFALLYTIVCYGILFTYKLGLQTAAEDGARAALRHQTDLSARQAQAETVALRQTQGWLPAAAGPLVSSSIERNDPGAPCNAAATQWCQIVVTVTAEDLHEVLPPFPGFALPTRLTGQASVLLDGAAL